MTDLPSNPDRAGSPQKQRPGTAPRFTILLPVVRPPVLLPQAIESVLAQSIPEFELFVVCDGAPRETIEYVEQLARRDCRIRVFDFPKGERIGESHLHAALGVASGQYVAHIEDDDLWFPNHLSELQILLGQADFGHVIHTMSYPDGRIHAIPSDVGDPAFRKRLLKGFFNSFGYSVAGYRLDAYRRLPEGWSTTPVGIWPDLYFWRKFLGSTEFTCGTHMVITAIALPGNVRPDMSLEERALESRDWLRRISDPLQRAGITEAAWRSIMQEQVRSEIRALELESSLFETKALVAELEAVNKENLPGIQARVAKYADTEHQLERVQKAYKISQDSCEHWTAELRKLQIEIDLMKRSKAWRMTASLEVMMQKALSLVKKRQ
jgi:hypothetical protein